jgi:signal transduction histidine kinase
MTQGRLRLHHRIAIPLALLALLATSIAALVAVSAISGTLQARVETQALNTSAVVGQSDFALNAAILKSAKAITGANIITYTSNGQILATTVEPQDGNQRLTAAVTAPDVTRAAMSSSATTPVVRIMDCGKPCLVVHRRLTMRPDTLVAVVADTSELTAATRRLAATVLLGAGLSLAVMIVLGQVITRRVTAPIDAALVRSEKLALAGLMAARVAHDIRNPLSSIKMQTQLVGARLRGDAETQAQVGAVLRDIQQVETVVKDLIELARPGELRPRAMALNDVVRDVLIQLTPQLTYRKIVVEADLADALPMVSIDPDRFRQVLINILGNAADAMTTGGTLRITTRPDASGSTVILEVCDDGVGIDPSIRDRVFDPFVSTKRDGVGLGLVNAKAVIESHGGTIALFAAEPKGTCARITMPLGQAPSHG